MIYRPILVKEKSIVINCSLTFRRRVVVYRIWLSSDWGEEGGKKRSSSMSPTFFFFDVVKGHTWRGLWQAAGTLPHLQSTPSSSLLCLNSVLVSTTYYELDLLIEFLVVANVSVYRLGQIDIKTYFHFCVNDYCIFLQIHVYFLYTILIIVE